MCPHEYSDAVGVSGGDLSLGVHLQKKEKEVDSKRHLQRVVDFGAVTSCADPTFTEAGANAVVTKNISSVI